MVNNNYSQQDLIAKFCPLLNGINLPNDQYKSKFYSLLNACTTNDSNLKISALRVVLESEYKHLEGNEVFPLKTAIKENKTLNKYIQAINLDINEESRFGSHAKERESDKELVDCLVQFFFMYLYSTYNDHTADLDFSIINATMDDKSVGKIKQDIIDMHSTNSATTLVIILNTLNPYLDKLPNLKKLINEDLADNNSFLSHIQSKDLPSLMGTRVPKK